MLVGRGVDLRGVDLAGMNLGGHPLPGSLTSEVVGCPAVLPDVDWLCVTQPKTQLSALLGPDVQIEQDLSGLDLSGANLARAGIEGSDFGGSDLSGVLLTDVYLRESSLVGADLSGADLSGATLRGVAAFDLIACPATLAAGHACRLQPAHGRHALLGAYLRLTTPSPSQVSANMQGADLSGIDMYRLVADGVDFTQADLGGSVLRYASLLGASLSGANLDGADLAYVSVDAGTSFVGAITSASTTCPDGAAGPCAF